MFSRSTFFATAMDIMLWLTFFIFSLVSSSRIQSKWLRECRVYAGKHYVS